MDLESHCDCCQGVCEVGLVSTVRVSVTAVQYQKTVKHWMASVDMAVPLTSLDQPVKVTQPVDSQHHVPLYY